LKNVASKTAAFGVTLSNFLSGLLTDAIVLHCASPRGVAPVDAFPGAAGITPRGERYQPCGWTAPLARTVDLKTFQNQTATKPPLNPPSPG
jgi:hypothetical protein